MADDAAAILGCRLDDVAARFEGGRVRAVGPAPGVVALHEGQADG
jgi:hypothetical protein